MHHILNSQTFGIDFDLYASYVESIRHKIPEHVYAFASDPQHFDLTSHSSLHDSWIDTLTVREVKENTNSEARKLEVILRLFGPFHDRYINFRYVGVTEYSFVMPSRIGHPRYQHISHGDLYTHEVRMDADGLLTHEILFEGDSTLLIVCADFVHWEEIVDAA